MNSGVVPISDLNLILSVILVLIVGAISASLKLGMLKSLIWGSIRTFVQLFIMGYALVWIFSVDSPILVAGLVILMCFIASRTAVKRTPNISNFPAVLAFISLTASTYLVTFFVTFAVISADRWYTARIVIPIAGMVLGNSMNGLSLGIDRLYSEVRSRSWEIETQLALGATPWEAVRSHLKEALRAGMTPSINSLMVVGIVTLPGMMTGQILAGADPHQAVRYQIVVMLMVTAAAAAGCLLLVMLSYKRLFDKEGALRQELKGSGK
ncbi:iron export ABC transporter permease subunit FetB [bacterium]|nr:iron export ABC transporter permease subunit FetB [FCB group bacterium]MBL7190803.1 iron export ABC transporter permease subunit FetB [bacterium]